MTAAVLAPAGVRTNAKVDVFNIEAAGVLLDRKIVVEMDCGHIHNVSIPLTWPVPQVGEEGRCLVCSVRRA